MPEEKQQKLAIVVKSDTYEDMVLALSFAGIAVNSGIETAMFFTSRASRVLKKGGFEELENAPLDAVGEKYRDRCAEMGFANMADVLGQLKQKGGLRVYVCTRGMRGFDIRQEDLIPQCDGVIGTATFLLQEIMTSTSIVTF
ncbi:MAG: hypothetical protein EXR59_04480 [Dehalococcoidia bacterium]|nr:hypothetical protein [Dehalococcoidia bacterium]